MLSTPSRHRRGSTMGGWMAGNRKRTKSGKLTDPMVILENMGPRHALSGVFSPQATNAYPRIKHLLKRLVFGLEVFG